MQKLLTRKYQVTERIIKFEKNGLTIKWIEFRNDNGELHREDGPAYQLFFSNGKIDFEKYYVNGKLHRLDGPAYIEYEKSGCIRYKQYWKNGQRYYK